MKIKETNPTGDGGLHVCEHGIIRKVCRKCADLLAFYFYAKEAQRLIDNLNAYDGGEVLSSDAQEAFALLRKIASHK